MLMNISFTVLGCLRILDRCKDLFTVSRMFMMTAYCYISIDCYVCINLSYAMCYRNRIHLFDISASSLIKT